MVVLLDLGRGHSMEYHNVAPYDGTKRAFVWGPVSHMDQFRKLEEILSGHNVRGRSKVLVAFWLRHLWSKAVAVAGLFQQGSQWKQTVLESLQTTVRQNERVYGAIHLSFGGGSGAVVESSALLCLEPNMGSRQVSKRTVVPMACPGVFRPLPRIGKSILVAYEGSL